MEIKCSFAGENHRITFVMNFNPFKQLVADYKDKFEPESIRHIADFNWRTIIAVFFLLCVLDIGAGSFEFYSVYGNEVSQVASQTKPQAPFAENQLQAFVNIIENRHVSYEVIAARANSTSTTKSK